MIGLVQWLILPLFLVSNQANEFRIDPTNTKIEFSAKHFGVINVRGHFSKFEGNLTFHNDRLKSASIRIDVNSITTKNNGRDRSLKNETFLDTSAYPFIIFNSNGNVTPESFEGTLTIKESSKVASISYTQSRKNGTYILNGECILKRTDYDLVFGSMDDLVSNEIRVYLEVTLGQKKAP